MFDKDLLKKIDWITILLVLTLFIIGLTSIASIMADARNLSSGVDTEVQSVHDGKVEVLAKY